MDESRVQGYVEARALKKEYAVKFAAERAEILSSVQLAVIEYANANGGSRISW